MSVNLLLSGGCRIRSSQKAKASAHPLVQAYHLLNRALGPQHWWPGETTFEIIVGAILTQSTAWTNVEKAIINLKREGVLSPKRMANLPLQRLARLIRPSGYFNQKARRLKTFLSFLAQFGTLKKMFCEPTERLRRNLLALNGIGPETADSILLYGGGQPIFVVDAYTRRILKRHGWVHDKASYEEIQNLFHKHVRRNSHLYNQYHALLVNVGKNSCKRSTPLCQECPLKSMLPPHGVVRTPKI